MIKVSEKFTFSEKHRGLTAPEKFSRETFFLELLTWPIWKSWETWAGREGKTPGSKWWQRRQDPPETFCCQDGIPRKRSLEFEWKNQSSKPHLADTLTELRRVNVNGDRGHFLKTDDYFLSSRSKELHILNDFTISKGFWIVRQMKKDKQAT